MVEIKGGDKLAAALETMSRNVEKAATVNIGFLEGATYPDGTPVAMVAAIQEFGAPSRNIPPRPYFRDMIASKSGEWPDAVGNLLVEHDYDAAKTLGLAGEAIAGQLRQSIADFSGVPLAPATVQRKGSSKQLVDTGHMLQSVSYNVE